MACFTVSLAEGLVAGGVALALHILSKKEIEKRIAAGENQEEITTTTGKWSKRVASLSYITLGGSALLAFEHIWHGEITFTFPFLTAVSEGVEATNIMLNEIATTGVLMAVLCTVFWGVITLFSILREKKAAKEAAKKVINQ